MLIPDGTFIAAALAVGATIGGSCVAILDRKRRQTAIAAQDLAICRAEDLAGKLFKAEQDKAELRLRLDRAYATLEQFADEDAGLDQDVVA